MGPDSGPTQSLAPSSGRGSVEIERVPADDDVTARAKRLLERDREILDRLAQ